MHKAWMSVCCSKSKMPSTAAAQPWAGSLVCIATKRQRRRGNTYGPFKGKKPLVLDRPPVKKVYKLELQSCIDLHRISNHTGSALYQVPKLNFRH